MTASPSSAVHANKLLGKRVLGGGGGTIARLVADETVCPPRSARLATRSAALGEEMPRV